MKIVFFGTSRVAAEFLEFLNTYHQIVLVITTCPKPAGRGLKEKQSPVADFSQKIGLEMVFVEKFNDEVVEKVIASCADIGVVVDFGKIIPEEVFKIPRYQTINVHFSLLPRWRGAAPIPWTLLSGDKETGVSIFYLEKTLDTGPLLATAKIPVSDDDDGFSLENKLVELGKKLLLQTIEDIEQGKVKITPQEGEVTFSPPIKKQQGLINWAEPAVNIYNQVRALIKWPVAYTFYPAKDSKKILKILRAKVLTYCPGYDDCCPVAFACGTVTGLKKQVGFVVRCGKDFLLVEKVLPQDKKVLNAWDFWQGARLKIGVKLG